MNHAHHYIIEMPNGPTSEGVCKACGATKQFPNYLDETFSVVTDYNVRRARRELRAAGMR